MRISDWSSDVCSSDLIADVYSFYAGPTFARRIARLDVGAGYRFGYTKTDIDTPGAATAGLPEGIFDSSTNHAAWASVEIGRAACRGRVCTYVSFSEVAV